MFTTKNLVHDIKQVPAPWIFEHFCKLKQKLNGHDIKIKSLFNPQERTPSMCIYSTESGEYRFKDFSSGKGGDGISLVKEVYQLKYHEACQLIVENYNDYVLKNHGGYDSGEFVKASKYKVMSFTIRSWTTQDQHFWTQFNIGSKLLEAHNIKPLSHYKMSNEDKELTITGNYLYGYFRNDGTLYKIYQPKTPDKKFIKISDYIQGSEQLNNHDFLIITSSLKDIMTIKSLKLKADVIAPDSENTIIKKDQMEKFIKLYKKVVLLFDYDKAGIESMLQYKKLYPSVKTCVLPLSKDVSDSVKDFGAKEVRNRLIPIINKQLNEQEDKSYKD